MAEKCERIFNLIPDGATLMECYETETEIIVCSDPLDEQDHNCDQMGCSSISHVRYRFRKNI